MFNEGPRSYVVRIVKSKAHIPQNNALMLGNMTEPHSEEVTQILGFMFMLILGVKTMANGFVF